MVDLIYIASKKKSTDPIDLFLTSCTEKVRKTSKKLHISCNRNSDGSILRIGSRASSNYYRVYEKKNGLEFELEMKKEVVKSVQVLTV